MSLLTDELTEKETLILVMLAKGYTGKEIAARMDLSESHIWGLIREIRNKLGAATDIQMVVMALTAGIIE